MSRQHTPTELNDALKGTKPTFLMLLFFSCVINMLMLAPGNLYATGLRPCAGQ